MNEEYTEDLHITAESAAQRTRHALAVRGMTLPAIATAIRDAADRGENSVEVPVDPKKADSFANTFASLGFTATCIREGYYRSLQISW